MAAVEAWLKSLQPSAVAPNDYQAAAADEESEVPEYEGRMPRAVLSTGKRSQHHQNVRDLPFVFALSYSHQTSFLRLSVYAKRV